MKHFINDNDFTQNEILEIFKKTSLLKEKKKKNIQALILSGKILAMIFQKPSTRTRISFEAGIYQLGGIGFNLSASDLQLGRGETIADTARVLSRYVDGIMARVYNHKDIIELAENSTVPVINGLSDLFHPCQALTDYFTIQEKLGTLKQLTLAYIGDGNNVCHSLLISGAILGVNVFVATPKGYEIQKDILNEGNLIAKKTNSKIFITNNPEEAAKNADVLYTDVWTSMGQEKEKQDRLKAFSGYQINNKLLTLAKKDVLVMHCLPAHREEEISSEVIDGPNSIVFDQAENRLHVQKGIMAYLMG
jgi:ornithine carbamoyltransferase